MFINRSIQLRVAFVAFHFSYLPWLGISRGQVSLVAGCLPWPGLAMSLSQQEDALVNALKNWLEESSAWAEDKGLPDGSGRVIVCLDVAEDSLKYVITAQALIANLHLLKHVVRATPKPTQMKTLTPRPPW